MSRMRNIQALRAVAVLAVVFFHLLSVEKKYGGVQTVLPGWLDFGMFGVDLFFVISGFVMVTVSLGRFRVPAQANRFLYHRVTRIYPLYWVYTTIALVVFLVQPTWVNSSQGNQVDIVASYLLLPTGRLPLVQVGWTLIHEMYFYLVFFLLMRYLPERRLPLSMVAWGVIVVALGPATSGPFLDVAFNPLTLEFLAGCLIAWQYHHGRPIRVPGRLLAAVAGAALVAAIAGYSLWAGVHGADLPTGWAQVGLYGIPAAIIVFCMTHAERSGTVMPGPLVRNGDASYSTYLSHLFVINLVGRGWAMVARDGVLDNIVALLTALTLVLIVGVLSYRFVEMPLLRITRRVA